MLSILRERFSQGYRTAAFPQAPPQIPDRFRGLPILQPDKCEQGCQDCVDVCPTEAIKAPDGKLALDMGRCLFCVECSQACPTGAIQLSTDYRLAARRREDLVLDGGKFALADSFDKKIKNLFGRSLKLRQVSAGGCNGCEADTNVLGTLVFDLGRFGIDFVASPRHADGLLITGPVTDNMKEALIIAYEAVPAPKIVIAVGACAISGGPFIGHSVCNNGADSVVPVDVFIPGCPPSPWSILDGLLRVLGRLEGTPVE